MSGGGGKGSSPDMQNITSTSKSEPWGPIQPYLTGLAGAAAQNFGKPPAYYPGQTSVPFSPQTEMGLNLITGRALAGSPVNDAAQGLGAATLSGDFLNSNPWLDQTYGRAAEGVMSGINSTFGGAGRTGSGAHADSLGTGLADLATGIYGGNYQQERDRMQQAMGFSPMLAASDYQDFDRLLGVGGAVEGRGQNILNDEMNRFNYYQNLPNQQLGNLASILGPLAGAGGSSTGTTQTPMYGGSPLTGALGGGMAGAGLLSSLGPSGAGMIAAGSPWGWALPAAGAVMGGMK